ncbi:DUF3221 domain-containing protein [Bacillus sp. AK128]
MIKRTFIGVMIGLFMFIVSCAQNSSSDTTNEVKDITGYVMTVTGDIILVTEKTDGSQPNAAVYTITEETTIVSSDGETLSKTDLTIGAEVTVWHTGVVQESFPTQATAAKMVVNTTEQAQTIAKAILVANDTLDSNETWWVKSVEEKENMYHITFSVLMGEEDPIMVKVNQDFQVVE